MQGDIALSGVIGALSYALDITEGRPEGHALRSCAIGMRIAQELARPGAVRSDLFYALLLKDAGCSANAERMAALFGADDPAAKRTSKLVDWSSPWQATRWSLRTVAPQGSLRERVARLQGIRDEGEATRKLMEARCDRGAEIARMLYLSEETAAAIRSLDEHWDGRGHPDGLAGEEIPLLARVLCLAQTPEIFHAAGGVKAARTVAVRRRGRWFEPSGGRRVPGHLPRSRLLGVARRGGRLALGAGGSRAAGRRADRRSRGEPPRADRRHGLPARARRRGAGPAGAGAGHGRRLRGAHGRPALPRAAAGGQGARHRLLGGPRAARSHGLRGARGVARTEH